MFQIPCITWKRIITSTPNKIDSNNFFCQNCSSKTVQIVKTGWHIFLDILAFCTLLTFVLLVSYPIRIWLFINLIHACVYRLSLFFAIWSSQSKHFVHHGSPSMFDLSVLIFLCLFIFSLSLFRAHFPFIS